MKKKAMVCVVLVLLMQQLCAAGYKKASAGVVTFYAPSTYSEEKLYEMAKSMANTKSTDDATILSQTGLIYGNGYTLVVLMMLSNGRYSVSQADGYEVKYMELYWNFNSARADYDRLVNTCLKKYF